MPVRFSLGNALLADVLPTDTFLNIFPLFHTGGLFSFSVPLLLLGDHFLALGLFFCPAGSFFLFFLLGFFGSFLDRFGQAHTAFFTGVGFLELALAASTRVDLALHDPDRPWQLLGRLDRLLDAHRREALRRRHPVA